MYNIINNGNIDIKYYNWNGLKNYGSMKNEILHFCECEFKNLTLNLSENKLKSIVFENCKGTINIIGNVSENITVNVKNSHFDGFIITNSICEKFEICDKSTGDYNINNNKINNLIIYDSLKSSFLKLTYILPITLLLLNMLCQGFLKYQVNIVIMFMFFLGFIALGTGFIVNNDKYTKKYYNDNLSMISYYRYLSKIISGIDILSIFFIIIYCKYIIKSNNINITMNMIQNEAFIYLIMIIVSVNIAVIHNLMNLPVSYNRFYKVNITDNEINMLKIISDNNNNYMSNFLFSEKLTLIKLQNNKNINELQLINYEGQNIFEKLLFLLDKENIIIDSVENIMEIKNNENIKVLNKMLEIKNKKFDFNLFDNNFTLFSYTFLSSIFYGVMKFFYPLFVRPKNICLAVVVYIILGVYLFSNDNMTITDTTTQVYLENLKIYNKENSLHKKEMHTEEFFNIKGNKETKISLPSFYPEYLPISYSISILTPFLETEQKKLYRANNKYTEIFILIYKILGIIFVSALALIIGRYFIPFIKIEKD